MVPSLCCSIVVRRLRFCHVIQVAEIRSTTHIADMWRLRIGRTATDSTRTATISSLARDEALSTSTLKHSFYKAAAVATGLRYTFSYTASMLTGAKWGLFWVLLAEQDVWAPGLSKQNPWLRTDNHWAKINNMVHLTSSLRSCCQVLLVASLIDSWEKLFCCCIKVWSRLFLVSYSFVYTCINQWCNGEGQRGVSRLQAQPKGRVKLALSGKGYATECFLLNSIIEK